MPFIKRDKPFSSTQISAEVECVAVEVNEPWEVVSTSTDQSTFINSAPAGASSNLHEIELQPLLSLRSW